MALLGLIVSLALAGVLGILVTAYNKRGDDLKDAQDACERARQELSLTAESLFRLQQLWSNETGLVPIALEYVRRFDKEPQSGEWKFHQAYALMQKDSRVLGPKWKIGLAIHQALAELRST